jgi:isoleucyl-tRNA synthetase
LNSLHNLAEVVIVSDLAVHSPGKEKPQNATQGEYFEGIAIAVSPASGGKCERCWMYSEQVGENTEHPDLCPRCADVLKRL